MTVAGVGLATKAERGLEFYRTPIEATRALIAIEGDRLPQNIWEPACGDGAIAEPLKATGRHVYASDIVDRGYGHVADFLQVVEGVQSAVVTNPPFSLAQDFVDKAFSFDRLHYCALLLRLAFLESGRRKKWFAARPPARVHVSSRRLPMMHRDGWTGNKSTSALAHAWFIWLRGYDGPPQLRWFDWQDHSGAPAALPPEGGR
jgi:hypothetical protein